MSHQPFVAWLVSNEYSPATIRKYTRVLACFFAETGAGPAPDRPARPARRPARARRPAKDPGRRAFRGGFSHPDPGPAGPPPRARPGGETPAETGRPVRREPAAL